MNRTGSDFGYFREATARKAYDCYFCFQPIAPGTRYRRYVGVFEGEWQNWTIHLPCQKAFNSWDDGDHYLPSEPLGSAGYIQAFVEAGVAEEAAAYFTPKWSYIGDTALDVLMAISRWLDRLPKPWYDDLVRLSYLGERIEGAERQDVTDAGRATTMLSGAAR